MRETLQIVRLCSSSYQRANYQDLEAAEFTQMSEVQYCYDKVPDQGSLILITNTQLNFNEISQGILERTKLIIHPNSGFDNIPRSLIEEYDFPVILGNPIRARAVVEYSLSCLFHHYTSIPFNQKWQAGRQWNRKLISNQNIQIIGHGHIGKLLKQSLEPLCKNVWVSDPMFKNSQWNPKEADVIIMAAALDSKSSEIIEEGTLKQFGPDILLINGARGGLIHQEDLIGFLSENKSATAYLDVFKNEPFTNEFEKLENVHLTSHIAGVHKFLDNAIAHYVGTVVKDYIKNDNFKKSYEHLNLTNFNASSFLS